MYSAQENSTQTAAIENLSKELISTKSLDYSDKKLNDTGIPINPNGTVGSVSLINDDTNANAKDTIQTVDILYEAISDGSVDESGDFSKGK